MAGASLFIVLASSETHTDLDIVRGKLVQLELKSMPTKSSTHYPALLKIFT